MVFKKSDPIALQKLRDRVKEQKQVANNGTMSRTTYSSAPQSSNKSDPEALKRLREKVAQEKAKNNKPKVVT